MLRGAKVTGEEEGKEEDTLGPGGRAHPQANTRLTPSATRRGRGRVWGGFILLYFTSRAGPTRPFPGVLGGGAGGRHKRSLVVASYPAARAFSPLGISVLRLRPGYSGFREQRIVGPLTKPTHTQDRLIGAPPPPVHQWRSWKLNWYQTLPSRLPLISHLPPRPTVLTVYLPNTLPFTSTGVLGGGLGVGEGGAGKRERLFSRF